MTIIYWTASWLVGIWLASLWDMPNLFWLLPVTLGIVGAISVRQKPIIRTLFICLSLAGLGAVRYSQTDSSIDKNHVAYYNGTNSLTLTGLITSEPDIRDSSIGYLVDVESLSRAGSDEQPASGQVLVRAPRYSTFDYGTRLQLTGQLNTPQNISDFDYKQYLARRGILSIMAQPDITILETGMGNPITHFLLSIKAHAQRTINNLLPEPQASLLSGILLGNDLGLPQDLREDFRTTGTSHIIAISGFNIAIIAGILLRGSRYFVAYRMSAWIALFGIALYTILVGAEASVVRAAIMGALFIVAVQFLGRPTFIPAALFSAALGMTLVNPHALWDVGFQLSFMAVLGLMFYVGPWSRQLENRLQPRLDLDNARRTTRMISDVFLTTMAATLMTLPVILYHFGTLSLISPIANLLILPAQPGIMIWGGLATILGMILPVLGQLPAWVTWLFLTYTINLVRFFADLPLTTVPISIPLSALIAIYILIFSLTWLSSLDKDGRLKVLGHTQKSRIKRAALVVGAISALLVFFWAWNQPDDKLHVSFLDVGQGDAIFIQTPGRRQILVDGGRYSSLLLDQLGREMPFWDKEIDILLATHPDEDHISGLAGLFDRYQVERFITNGEEEEESPAYEAMLQSAEVAQVPIHRALAGETVDLGDGVRLEILHPGPALSKEQRNDNSVSIRLVYGDFSLLLTGDAEGSAERTMMESGRPLQSLVYKAGHHGSRSSSNRSFLRAVQPQIIIISVGEENRYDHPHPEMLERAEEIGAAVLRTDELGTIELISDGHNTWWETHD